jgi:hypothetical protein
MPVFDRSASRFDRVEADFLRGVLGTGKHEATPFQHASREYRRRQQRGAAARALIVIVLLGSFCGSAAMMSETRHLSSEAAPMALNAPSLALFSARALKTASAPVEDAASRP